jgi:hypothetical protein
MRRLIGFLVRLALLAVILVVVAELWRARRGPTRPKTLPDAPFPFPPARRPGAGGHVHVPDVVDPGGGPETEDTILTEDAWIEPVGGACPPSHPVKAKMASGIFHVAGGRNYSRTVPDRCYVDPAAAEADGLRPAKS